MHINEVINMYMATITEMKNKTHLIKQAYLSDIKHNGYNKIKNALIDAENSLDEAMDFLKDARLIDNMNFKMATYSLVEDTLEMASVHYFQAVLFLEQSQCDFHIKNLLIAHCSHQIKSIKKMNIKDEM